MNSEAIDKAFRRIISEKQSKSKHAESNTFIQGYLPLNFTLCWQQGENIIKSIKRTLKMFP